MGPGAGLGLNAGNYLRLRPCPIWRGGPDRDGKMESGAEPYRDYMVRFERWVLTGERIGVALGLLASEFSDALPEGAKHLLKGITNQQLLDDGRNPGT